MIYRHRKFDPHSSTIFVEFLHANNNDPKSVIYPDPQFSWDTPNHLKFKGDYQGVFTGGVYVIVVEGVINNNKMLTM